ncbi:DUF5813 family protein [Halorussus litoreus]|uniref:DUF5813 family protein n=1 Tax=Halorussus litoreus TaxID=1710536 RepID=UPI000E231DA0|nr:DUF5813 family protein [Halorussus litoreus]
MTDERVERAFREHPSFERVDDENDEFETTFTSLDGVVSVIGESSGEESEDESDRREYRVAVTTPGIDAVVAGETVAEVVRDGWFETLERRLADAHTVASADEATPPTVEREGEDVVITVDFVQGDPDRAAEDAKAIVEYVEGTWVQGLIPGYDYREPAAGFRERAKQNYDEGDSGPTGDAGGTPL